MLPYHKHQLDAQLMPMFDQNDPSVWEHIYDNYAPLMYGTILKLTEDEAIAAAMQAKIIVTEYSPKKVKQSITGNGNADKDQVWKMLQRILNIEEKPQYFDATDALAVALCHHYQTTSVMGKAVKGLKGWNDFISKNPGRVKK